MSRHPIGDRAMTDAERQYAIAPHAQPVFR